jgi:DNA mismatch repair protein MutS
MALDPFPMAVRAAGALVRHLRDTQKTDLAHVRTVTLRQSVDGLVIDAPTLGHLEVVDAADGGRQGSLLGEIDRTVTPMGGRLLRQWLVRPLTDLERIRDRLDAVEDFAFRATDRGKFRETARTVQDIERIVARAALGIAGPRDLVALRQSLAAVPRLRLLISEFRSPLVAALVSELDDLEPLRAAIEHTLVDSPPALARDGGAVREGVDEELDRLRRISRSGREIIAAMEETERSRTGIGSLRIRYNRVFGYYIEVSKANLHLVPPDYHRKQTVAGGERFVTPALKTYEEQVLGADERILEREIEIFEALRTRVAADAPRVQATARAVRLHAGLAAQAPTPAPRHDPHPPRPHAPPGARAGAGGGGGGEGGGGGAAPAAAGNYTKPHVHDGDEILITDGRHPVVERHCRDPFVPNDVHLDNTTRQVVILTGPNMGGKSTYLRQIALTSLLAQAGSFVPAREAKLAVVDRIFARVGASDNIARGQSTFMVEMQETSRILHTVTPRSLVILDEIGRGTATFDGLSIAWAVAEYLATSPRARPKTVFATHYHELTDLADGLPGVVNYHVDAREWHEDIVFLRKVVPGRSDRSYGIQVARLAGLPWQVVGRAKEILDALERDALARGGRPSLAATPTSPEQQLGLFQAPSSGDRIVERLRSIAIERLTPLEALALLDEFKREIGQ